jgi:CBS domain-containing protein
MAIDDEDLLEQAIAEAERIVGGFDRPDSGLLLVLPVTQVRGLHKVQPKPARQRLPRAPRPEWMVQRETPVEEVIHILDLEPCIVQPDTPLDGVARIMLGYPRVHVASVVSATGQLVGILSLRTLADDLFYRIMPEEFLSEVTDYDRVLEFADRSRVRTASQAMQEPVWVKREETVKVAFQRMHENGLSGLPVIDDRYQVVSYINLLELMAVCLDSADSSDSQEAKA